MIHQWPTLFAIPHLKASRGAIVVVSSMYGLLTAPYQTAYSASKHALSGFFDSLRPELEAHGVSITLHHPGGVATEVTSKVPRPLSAQSTRRAHQGQLVYKNMWKNIVAQHSTLYS